MQGELWDVAGGRTDITYTPQPGSRFVTEVKWRTTPWTRTTIEQDYLAQAANYTATGPPVGLLLVGDYSDHSAGYRDIDDSIWVITHARTTIDVVRAHAEPNHITSLQIHQLPLLGGIPQ